MTTKAPLVSIALCTYNGAKYIVPQLETLVQQSYPNIELVAVDDGSSDDTVQILQSFAQTHPRFHIHRNTKNLGYIKNFEKAISLCTGDYIALADQDDIWALDKIELLLKHIGDSALIYHDSAFIDEQGRPMNQRVTNVRNFYAGLNSSVFLLENCVSGHALLFRRSLLPYFEGFPSVIIHDWWLAYIACNLGGITYINSQLVSYRQHTQANTNILRQDRGQVKKNDALLRMEKQLAITEAFVNYPHNTGIDFKKRFLSLMQKRMHSYFSFGLAWFIFSNRDTLLFIYKKPLLSKLNYALKFAWGYKIKKLLSK